MAEEQVRWRTRWDNSSLRRGVRTARKELRTLDKATAATAKRFAQAGAAAAAAGAVAGAWKLVNVTREYEKLNAQLITATGSQQDAALAWKAIQGLAAQTPYDLQQVTEGFTKLVNLGLTPSRDALISYGNTASATGKQLNDMIEAVADAATGEFERLKEFGIKASSQGDQVAFTFRGVTTTVQKNAAEIEKYLMSLGQNEYAGAMARQMDTLDGAISNLGDSWDQMFMSISEQGIGDLISEGVITATSAVDDFRASLDSGEFEARLNAIIGKFDGFGRSVGETMEYGSKEYNRQLIAMGAVTDNTVWLIEDAFRNMPENVHAAIQLLVVELASLVDYGQAYGTAFGEVLGVELAKIVDKAGAYGSELADMLNPFDGDTNDLEAALKRADAVAADMADAAFDRAEKEAEASRQARRASIVDIMAERDAALKSYADRLDGARKMREQWEEEQAKTDGDLGRHKKGGDGEDSSAAEAAKKEQEEFEKRLERLTKRYTTEQELKREHEQALADIERGFREGDIETKKEKDALIRQLDAEHMEKLKKARAAGMTELEQLSAASFRSQAESGSKYLSDLTASVANENRAMFEINKWAAATNALLNTREAVTGAYKYGSAIGGPVLGAAFGATAFAAQMSQVNAIRSQSYGSGGGAAPSLAGGTAATPVSPVSQGGQGIAGGGEESSRAVYLHGVEPGKMYDGRMLIDAINEAQEDGAELRIAS